MKICFPYGSVGSIPAVRTTLSIEDSASPHDRMPAAPWLGAKRTCLICFSPQRQVVMEKIHWEITRLYAFALLFGLLFQILTTWLSSPLQNSLFLGGALVALAVLSLRPSVFLNRFFLVLSVGFSVVASVYMSLRFTLSGPNATLFQAISAHPPWMSIVIGLFANRVFASHDRLVCFSLFRPKTEAKAKPARVVFNEILSATCLGVCFILGFYTLLGSLKPTVEAGTPFSIIWAAFFGDTTLHFLTLFVFFVVAGYLANWTCEHGSRKRRIEALLTNSSNPEEKDFPFYYAFFPDDPRVHFILSFEKSTRRFMRTLIALMPLLGFLGTIIGLAITIDALPQSLGATGEAAPEALSRGLSGIALKFQTTLLGLLGSIIATLWLHYLEKKEEEFLSYLSYLRKNQEKQILDKKD